MRMVYEFFLSFTIFFLFVCFLFFWSLEGYVFSLLVFLQESQLCIKRNHLNYFDRGLACVLVCVYSCVYV